MPDRDDPILTAQRESKAQYEKLKESEQHLSNLRIELDRLGDLGDMVAPDDVVKSGATLVGKGFTPQEIATVLSSMPMEGGEMLAQWVATHESIVAQMEQALEAQLGEMRHVGAVSTMHALLQEHLRGGQPPQSAPPAMGMAPQGDGAPLRSGLAIEDMKPQGSA